MILKEVCENFCIDKRTLMELCDNGIVGQKEDKKCVFNDDDIELLGEILFLKSVGLSKEEYTNFCKIDEQERERLLKNVRKRLLNEVHQNEKNIAKIDCYLFHLKEEGVKK